MNRIPANRRQGGLGEPYSRNPARMKPRAPSRFLPLALLGLGLLVAGCGSDSAAPAPTAAPIVTIPDLGGSASGATTGISMDRIRFGQSAAFTGPAGELGIGLRRGIESAFAEANREGGVHGRMLELVAFDDHYEPEKAINNTMQLIEQEEVFALIGEVGTPTSRSVAPVAAEAGVPFIAPFTGAAFLRDESWSNIINLRASYEQETEEMVARLTADLGIERIAIMYQDDSFGRAGYQGALEALQRRNMQPVSIGLYPRNTTAVKTGLLDLMQGDPEGVIVVGAYQPVAALIAWARHIGMDSVFITLSFVGSNALAQELGPTGEGVFVTQVVPFPNDVSQPLVASYQRALTEYDPEAEPGFVSLEGYLAGRLVIAGLERCGRVVDRTCFLDATLRREDVDIDGFALTFGAGDNQGSDQVFVTVIGGDGSYRPTDSLRLDDGGS